MVGNSGGGSFLVRGGLTESIESQVAGVCTAPQTLKLFQLLCGSKFTKINI